METIVCSDWENFELQLQKLIQFRDVLIPVTEERDILWKFDVPIDERTKVLKYLEMHNINAFSLFNSTESLMETIAMREFFLKG